MIVQMASAKVKPEGVSDVQAATKKRAAYRGQPADGEFHATHVLVRDGSRWRFAGQHLSSIGSPPPIGPAGAGKEPS
jgi:hypothetical protein